MKVQVGDQKAVIKFVRKNSKKHTPTNIMGVSNLWNGLWNGPMEWTDGMQYQLTIIAKTHHRYKCCLAIARFNWTVKCRASYPSQPTLVRVD